MPITIELLEQIPGKPTYLGEWFKAPDLPAYTGSGFGWVVNSTIESGLFGYANIYLKTSGHVDPCCGDLTAKEFLDLAQYAYAVECVCLKEVLNEAP